MGIKDIIEPESLKYLIFIFAAIGLVRIIWHLMRNRFRGRDLASALAYTAILIFVGAVVFFAFGISNQQDDSPQKNVLARLEEYGEITSLASLVEEAYEMQKLEEELAAMEAEIDAQDLLNGEMMSTPRKEERRLTETDEDKFPSITIVTIKAFLEAEDSEDFDRVASFYTADGAIYYYSELYSDVESLKKRYKTDWGRRKKGSGTNEFVDWIRMEENKYQLVTNFSFVRKSDGAFKKLSGSRVIFRFNRQGKINSIGEN